MNEIEPWLEETILRTINRVEGYYKSGDYNLAQTAQQMVFNLTGSLKHAGHDVTHFEKKINDLVLRYEGGGDRTTTM